MNTEEFIRTYNENVNLDCFGGYRGPMYMNDEIIVFSGNGQESNGKYTRVDFYARAKLKNEIEKFETITFEYDEDQSEAAFEILDSCSLDISELTIKGA